MADVFISYSGKSPNAAEQIADALERAGISCWFAKRNIQPGQTFPEVIPNAIKNCKVFLLILDKNSNQSQHVLNEISLAFRRKNNHEAIEFVVFKTDNCKVSVDIDYFLNRFQHMDGAPPDAQRVSGLIRRIAELLGKKLPIKETKQEESLWEEMNLPVIIAAAIITLLLMVVVGVAIKQKLKSDHIEWTLDNGILTISGKGSMRNYEYLYNYRIADSYATTPWWEQKDDINSIIIESGVTSIGLSAFTQCKNLTTVIIPDSVTSIGYCAFWNCKELIDVTIPDSVTSIGDYAFGMCENLESVSIPEGAEIGYGAFPYRTTVTRRES